MAVLMDTLRLVKRTTPKAGCFENVAKLMQCDEGEKSPAEMVMDELRRLNYSVFCQEICLSTFHSALRRRPASSNDNPS